LPERRFEEEIPMVEVISKMADLPDGLQLIAKKCGIDVAMSLYQHFPGATIHIPEDTTREKPGDLMNLWNKYAQMADLYMANKMTMPRTRNCRARLRERKLAEWEDVFKRIIANPYLTGKNKDNWKAGFDWIIKNDNNSQKVMEGFYDRNKPGQATGYTYDKYRK
jgi:hypothetical protein